MSAPAVPYRPKVSERVQSLIDQMTLEEKLAQLVSFWPDQDGNVVAPMQGEMASVGSGQTLTAVTKHGLGQYTRVYGTRPVDPIARAHWLWAEQRRLKRETRLGIPALVHEECLTGLNAWQAANFPTPLAWGASFDPELVYQAGQVIGESMRALGIHLGLAPVLDVIRDPRWGRVDECISEDPYLVGTIGTNYVRGLQSTGVHATLKHFLGYGGSRAGRNHAPVSAGPRELADIYLPPFEMAIRDGGVRSVMNSYTDVDGLPMVANEEYLSGVLRGKLGFTGTVLADYYAVGFLQVMHAVAANGADAAAQALRAGLDVELPGQDAFPLLAESVRSGDLDEAYIDRALGRHLSQKEELGLLDPDAFEDDPPASIDLDSPKHREIARRLAEESIVLLANDGVLPLDGRARPLRTIAVIGPNADSAEALQGCYSFANHVLAHFPGYELGFEIPTVLEALQTLAADGSWPGAAPQVITAAGCAVSGTDTSGFAEAVATAQSADVVIAVVGDRAGLFGRGTVGEGNDVESLDLPGVQRELVEALVATGTPVVTVLVTGRPYDLRWALEPQLNPARSHGKVAAMIQAFFPGEGGGLALADVLTGRVNPSGRLPVSLPRSAGAQPYGYLHPILGGPSPVTNTDPTPLRPFGFGLGYTTFEYSDLTAAAQVAAGDSFRVAVTVTNSGPVGGTDVVQLYGHDVLGSITRPLAQLLGYQRVHLEPGQSRRLTFLVPTTRFAFTDRRLVKIVEPGEVEVWVGAHAAASQPRAGTGEQDSITNETSRKGARLPGAATPRAVMQITGPVHEVTGADDRWVRCEVH